MRSGPHYTWHSPTHSSPSQELQPFTAPPPPAVPFDTKVEGYQTCVTVVCVKAVVGGLGFTRSLPHSASDPF